ncbi:divalent-cation tolerance protein CutA [Nitratifractor sp.]
MRNEAVAILVTTTDTPEEAREIARTLLERRLAACVQIVPITSLYRWRGAIEEAEEWRLEIKAPMRHVEAIRETIVRIHSYEVPEVLLLHANAAHEPYARWLREETHSPQS